jgi:hypothetical protein
LGSSSLRLTLDLPFWPSLGLVLLSNSPSPFPPLLRRFQIFEQTKKAIEAIKNDTYGGSLRDHRPLQCNADDYERMAAVPSFKGACYRHMPGVVENKDHTCCAGHFHAMNRNKGGVVSSQLPILFTSGPSQVDT